MHFIVTSTWLNTMTRFDIGDSMASLTTILLQKDMILLRDQKLMLLTEPHSARLTATIFKAIRTPLLLHAIKQLAYVYTKGLLEEKLTANYLSDLIQSIKSTYQGLVATTSGARLLYVKFMHEVLATIFQFCQSILRLFTSEQRAAIDWLCNSRNVPQVRDDFTAETFRSYSTANLTKKGQEIALNLSARCDAELLDATLGLDISLRAALNNNPLRLETSCQWDHDVASLRRFVVVEVISSFLQLSSTHAAASLYLAILLPTAKRLYLDLFEQAWSGNRAYIEALFIEINCVLEILTVHDQAEEICAVLRDILQMLSTYSWLQASKRSELQTINLSSSRESIKTVLRENVLSNWTATEDGYFHMRRRTTVRHPPKQLPINEPDHTISSALQRQRSMDNAFKPAFSSLDLSTVHI